MADVNNKTFRVVDIVVTIGVVLLTIIGGYFVMVLSRIDANLSEVDKRVVAIEAHSTSMQRQLTEIQLRVIEMPPDSWQKRVRSMENFLAQQGYEPPE
jgi:hypothetical protein